MRLVDPRLSAATVGVAGLGGLGSVVAVILARAGIGRLVLVDHDVVEAGNLDRQHYFIDQVGLPKVDALQATIRRISTQVQVVIHRASLDRGNIPSLFAGSHLIVECLDRPDQKQMLVETILACMTQPVVAASGIAGLGDSNAIKTRRFSNRLIVVGDEQSDAYAGLPLCPGRVWIAASHQANAAISLLLGLEP